MEAYVDVISVWPLEIGSVTYQIPFNVRKRTLSLSDMGANSISELLAGREYYSVCPTDDPLCVELDEESEQLVKSVTKKSVSGVYYEVSMSLVISAKSDKSIRLSDKMERIAHDFIFLLSDGSYHLVRASVYGVQCVSEESYQTDYKQKLSVSISCYNGIQLVES